MHKAGQSPASQSLDDKSRYVDWVRRIEAGDISAEREMCAAFWRGIYVILLRLCRDRDLAADIRQDAFETALENIRKGGLRRPESLKYYVASTARNKFLEWARKNRRQRTDVAGDFIASVAAIERGPLECLTEGQIVALVRQSIEDLPVRRDQDILFRFYLHGEDKAVICDHLQIDARHFDRVLYRARQRLRQLIEKHPAGDVRCTASVALLAVVVAFSGIFRSLASPPVNDCHLVREWSAPCHYPDENQSLAGKGRISPVFGTLT